LNAKGFGRIWSYSDQGTILDFLPGGTEEKPRKFLVRIASNLAKILFRYFVNANLKCYLMTNYNVACGSVWV
jgi:hypothetical protein